MQSVVNTAETSIFTTNHSGGLNDDRQGLISCCLRKKIPEESWGFRLQGGKDRGLPFQIVKVPLNSVAGLGGCRSNDYLVQINGRSVFELTHNEAKNIIMNSGEALDLVIERQTKPLHYHMNTNYVILTSVFDVHFRGENIVPSMSHMFPGGKKESNPEEAKETGELPGQHNKGFTTIGKPKMTTKQYMSPLEMYGEEALEEIMEQGTIL
ncbi:hypothetical protein TCAL_06948 [Tigriopus californicus]|uniref:PDZ domain-containing protein n=1 Tax=Tigriopus californicus TaxID=6832 RepID=A0A553PHW4_TIGCA|nr:hypothetical protein TCAL_06948 [Tigriopus californicus]